MQDQQSQNQNGHKECGQVIAHTVDLFPDLPNNGEELASALVNYIVKADTYDDYLAAVNAARNTAILRFDSPNKIWPVKQGSDIELVYTLIINPDAFPWQFAKSRGKISGGKPAEQPRDVHWGAEKAQSILNRKRLELTGRMPWKTQLKTAAQQSRVREVM